jgi:hypothetical protein
MEKVILNKEVVRDYNEKHREYKNRDRRLLHCRLCLPLWRAKQYWSEDRRIHSLFRGGEEVYQVTFCNGTKAYYHVQCVDRLVELCRNRDDFKVCNKLNHILKLDIHGTQFKGASETIKQMLKNSANVADVVRALQEKHGMSRATAYRKVRSLN